MTLCGDRLLTRLTAIDRSVYASPGSLRRAPDANITLQVNSSSGLKRRTYGHESNTAGPHVSEGPPGSQRQLGAGEGEWEFSGDRGLVGEDGKFWRQLVVTAADVKVLKAPELHAPKWSRLSVLGSV